MKQRIEEVQTLRPREAPHLWDDVYPFPEEPESPHHVPDPRTISDTWLAARYNDGHGSRSMHLQSFYWRVGNAFNLKALQEFKGHVGRLDQSSYLVAAIFRAAEGYDFCPGADLIALLNGDAAYRKLFYKTSQEVCYLMATMKTPAFACMQGHTMGLGAGLTGHSLFRVVTEFAVWAMPNVLYGAIPDCGMSFRLPRLQGEVGMFLALTGKRVETTDIMRIGLGTHFITLDGLQRFEQETGRVLENNLEDLFIFLNPHLDNDIDRLEKSAITQHLEAIQRCFDKSTLEEVFEALKKEETPWANRTLKRLNDECSPLMLHVTFRLMRIGRYLNSLEEALELEYRIMQHVINSYDYEEGIKSRMVTKRRPNWQHASIYDVSTKDVAKFFEPLPDELDLKPAQPGRRPEKNPYRVYIDQMASFVDEPMSDPLIYRALDRILPPTATLEEARAFYRRIMKEGGLDEEAGRYWKKIEEIERRSPHDLTVDELEKQVIDMSEPIDLMTAADEEDDDDEEEEELAILAATGGGDNEEDDKTSGDMPSQEKERG